MPTTKHCDQCDKHFTKPTEGRAILALNMHVGRAHKKNIRGAVRGAGRAKANGHTGIIEPAAATETGTLEHIDRRTRAWREANPGVAKGIGGYRPRRKVLDRPAFPVGACFCPRCGLNLLMLNTAMLVASKHSQ